MLSRDIVVQDIEQQSKKEPALDVFRGASVDMSQERFDSQSTFAGPSTQHNVQMQIFKREGDPIALKSPESDLE